MFGFFNNQKKLDAEYFQRSISIGHAYERLRERSNAAGYIFSSVLVDGNALLMDKSIHLREKLMIIERNLTETTPQRGFDGGLSIAALNFMALMLRSEMKIGFGSLTLSAAYSEIAKFGYRYRELNEYDYLPPESVRQRDLLSKSGVSTIAQLVDAIRRSGPEGEQTSGETDRSVANVMALLDLRLHETSDVLWNRLGEIESAILGQFVWR